MPSLEARLEPKGEVTKLFFFSGRETSKKGQLLTAIEETTNATWRLRNPCWAILDEKRSSSSIRKQSWIPYS